MRALLAVLSFCVWGGCRTAEPSLGSDIAVAPAKTTQQLATDAENSLRQRLASMGLTTPCPSGKICTTLIQLNDVSEIDGLGGGQSGGLDRVATIRRLLAEQQVGSVLLVVTGDFVAPSGLSTLKENGKAWAGEQTIAVLKATGANLATFGHHEFDLNTTELQARLDESATPANPKLESCQAIKPADFSTNASQLNLPGALDALRWRQAQARHADSIKIVAPPAVTPDDITCHGAQCTKATTNFSDPCLTPALTPSRDPAPCFSWVASNVMHKRDNQSAPIAWTAAHRVLPRARILEFGSGERPFRLGVVGLTLLRNPKDSVQFTDITAAAQQLVTALRNGLAEHPSVDGVLALTHMTQADDIALLEDVPGIDLSLGSHNHRQSAECVGETAKRCVTKADANARSIYVHRLTFDPKASDRRQRLTTRSELIAIDQSIPRDPFVKSLIDCYFQRAEIAAGTIYGRDIDLRAPIAQVTPHALDGTEAGVRQIGGTNLTARYTHAMLESARNAATDGKPYQLAMINSGSFHSDDYLGPGPISFYDAFRMLPFGGKLATASIKIRDLATILHRSWVDLPAGSGSILHIYPELPSLDLPKQEISIGGIIQDLMRLSGAPHPHTEIRVVTTEYLLKFGDDLTKEARLKFAIRGDSVRQADMRELLVEILRTAYPLSRQVSAYH